MRRLPASAGSVISFLLIYEDPTLLVQSFETHLNNISPAPAADHSMHCFRRWMTYETWWVGCMNYLRSSFCFSFHCSMSPFPFLSQNASCEGPRFLGVGLIHGRHSERHFVFGSSVVLYDSEFRACWRWTDLLTCLIPLLLLLGFLLFSIPFLYNAA